MHVVEHEDERLGCREPFKEVADRPVAAVPLVPKSLTSCRRQARERREDVREPVPGVVVQSVEPMRLQALQVLVEGVHEDGEGQLALELGGGPAEDQVPVPVGARRDLREQPRLPDARLADHLDRRGAATAKTAEHVVERAERLGTPNEVLGNGHQGDPAEHKSREREAQRSGSYPDVGGPPRRQARSMSRDALTTFFDGAPRP